MPEAPAEQPYSVQRLAGRFVIVWWEDRGEGPKRRRQFLASQDRPSAEAEARQRWHTGGDRAWTVGRCMTAYLASIAGKVSHPRREDAWKAMRHFWDEVDPHFVDEPMCRDYRKTRRVGDATARYELMQLSTALGWAAREGRIDRRPQVWLPPTPERKTRHLSTTDWQRFLAGIRADHARLYAMVGLHTMARPSAILDLTWDRVDFMRRQIDFTPPGHVRTAKRRVVAPMTDELLAVMQVAYSARTCEFVIERGGKRVASVKKAFLAASERSNVHATPYTLRHTGAVYAAEAGVSMPQLAQMMGHDDDRTTQKHYAHWTPDFNRDAAELIASKARG